MSTFKNVLVENTISVGGGAEFSNPIEVNSGVKFQGVTISDIIIVTGATGTINQDLSIGELPDGFTSENSIVLNVIVASNIGGYVSSTKSVMAYISQDNLVRVRADNEGYTNSSIKVVIMKIV